jgi:tetratricopeptide (TPR) repeat protein
MTLYPQFPRPYIVRGELRLIQGRADQAAKDFRQAMELGDQDPNTRVKLSRALAMQGDKDAASEAIRESLELDPVRQQLADAFKLQNTGKEAEAERIYRAVLKEDPENVDALRLLATMATEKRHHRDAEILLKRAIELTPDFGRALADLVICLVEQDKVDEACEYGERLLTVGADNANSHLVAGNAYSAAGRYDEAIALYRNALQKAPDHLGAMAGLAHNLKTIGQQDEAIEIYRQCLAINPYFVDTYWNLANLKTFRFTDDEIAEMEKLLEHPEIPDESQVFLQNALGFAHEGRKDYDKAFHHFARGNAVKRRLEYYDSVNTEFLFDRIIEVFDAERLSRQVAGGDADATPIFIVGLPRSGSTLLEQILASHSQVDGTSELPDISMIAQGLTQPRAGQSFPQCMPDLTESAVRELGERYLSQTRRHRGDAPFFTDKMPNNFAYVGFIKTILPNAKIIDARRHPMDSCFGCFKQHFAKGQTFTYDLFELGEFYLEYCELMDHWDKALPGAVLHVQYEEVVADLETQVRRILDYCGLPFEEACVNFHETERAVRTASSEQVRQPIYSGSVQTWTRYGGHLEPLKEVLEPVFPELPVAAV